MTFFFWAHSTNQEVHSTHDDTLIRLTRATVARRRSAKVLSAQTVGWLASCSDFTTSKGRKLGECNKFSPPGRCRTARFVERFQILSRAPYQHTVLRLSGGELCPHKPQASDGPEATVHQELYCTSRQFTNFEARLRTVGTHVKMHPIHDLFPALSRTLTGQERKYTLQTCSNLTPRENWHPKAVINSDVRINYTQ